MAVCRLENHGKTEEARAALAEIPIGKELHIRTIDNASRAMEGLFYTEALGARGSGQSAHRSGYVGSKKRDALFCFVLSVFMWLWCG